MMTLFCLCVFGALLTGTNFELKMRPNYFVSVRDQSYKTFLALKQVYPYFAMTTFEALNGFSLDLLALVSFERFKLKMCP